MRRVSFSSQKLKSVTLTLFQISKHQFLTNSLLHKPVYPQPTLKSSYRDVPHIANISFTRQIKTMTTITLDSPQVNVSLPEGFSEEQLHSFSPFKAWLKTLTNSLSLQHSNPNHPFRNDPYALRSITIQSYDLFGGKRVGFLKLQAKVTNSAGESLPGAVFLRGPAVAMLIILIPDDVVVAPASGAYYDEERYVLLTIQPRIPAGSLAFAELPAGMVDDDNNESEARFAGTAAREIHEELGIEISASELICLSDLASGAGSDASQEVEEERLPSAIYPSVGGCDEYIPIYMHERRVPRDTLAAWTGKLTGLRDHGEKITLKLVPMRDLWREGRRDAKALAALALWEALKREGKI